MRFIDRNPNLAPEALTSERTLRQVSEYGDFLRDGGSMVQQKRLPFTPDDLLYEHEREIAEALHLQFDRKCAFTEMRLQDFGTDEILLFRPNAGTAWKDDSWPDLYWWLMNDWHNFYAASTTVKRRRGQQFPVFESDRPTGPSDPLDTALLLDPCVDRPEWFLRFRADGSVAPAQITTAGSAQASPGGDQQATLNSHLWQRATTSIDLYSLAGGQATESRSFTFGQLGVADAHTADQIRAVLDGLTTEQEHLGAIRQVLAQATLDLLDDSADDVNDLVEHLAPELGALTWVEANAADQAVRAMGPGANDLLDRVGDVFPELQGFAGPVSDESYALLRPVSTSMIDDDTRVTPRSTTPAPQIASVSIRDFKAIRELDLDFVGVGADADEVLGFDVSAAASTSQQTVALTNEGRWIRRLQRLREVEMSSDEMNEPDTVTVTGSRALIGENGSGKSSVLQAIALALCPNDALTEIGDLTKFVRRGAPTGAAKIEIVMTNDAVFTLLIDATEGVSHTAMLGTEPIDLENTDDWFLLRAYSATRTLHGRASDIEAPAHIANMFDPTSPLIDAGEWLKPLEPGPFNIVATTLSKLFDSENRSITATDRDPEETRLQRRGEGDDTEIFVDGRPLSMVSDGYRAIVNLYCDIMAAAAQANRTDMRLASGIVLIDEIGAHLHPRWRMKIAGLLRREFRNMQIIVSTHEPLCLRGFVKNEVLVVERDPELGVRVEQVNRDPSSYRVDQLLTSEFFGLHSTLDPEESDRLDIYYQLSAKAATTPLSPAEVELLDETQPLRQDQVLGFSYREQLTYAAIDKYLTDRAAGLSPETLRERRGVAFDRVAEIWNEFDDRLGQVERGESGGST